MSTQPDLLAIAKQQQEALVGPIAGAAGGVGALVCAGVVFYLVRQRRARHEARMRMKASSRRFMGSQSSAYGNTHQDGAVNIGAAREREPRNETTVMFQVQLPQGSNLPASQQRPGGGGRRPARQNSMSKK